LRFREVKSDSDVKQGAGFHPVRDAMIESLREVPVNFHAPESNHRRCRIRLNFASATRVLNVLANRHVPRCLLSRDESKTHRLEDKTIHLFAAFAAVRLYLE
jgi:hypothetical protein